jgi:hypothetical protein
MTPSAPVLNREMTSTSMAARRVVIASTDDDDDVRSSPTIRHGSADPTPNAARGHGCMRWRLLAKARLMFRSRVGEKTAIRMTEQENDGISRRGAPFLLLAIPSCGLLASLPVERQRARDEYVFRDRRRKLHSVALAYIFRIMEPSSAVHTLVRRSGHCAGSCDRLDVTSETLRPHQIYPSPLFRKSSVLQGRVISLGEEVRGKQRSIVASRTLQAE